MGIGNSKDGRCRIYRTYIGYKWNIARRGRIGCAYGSSISISAGDMVISDTTAHYFKNIITASHQQWWGGKCKSSKPRIIPGASSTIGSRQDGSRKCGGQVRTNKFPNTDLQGIESYNIN